MLTFKGHEPKIDTDKGIIEVWNDERECYERHTFEFIEELAQMIMYARIEALAK